MMQARPTVYKGVQMRSRLEATYAQLMDKQSVPWVYEPECFADETGQYLPDFEFDFGGRGTRYFIEVKPAGTDPHEALAPMHIIRASMPKAWLMVWVHNGSWPVAQTMQEAVLCRPGHRCRHCAHEEEDVAA